MLLLLFGGDESTDDIGLVVVLVDEQCNDLDSGGCCCWWCLGCLVWSSLWPSTDCCWSGDELEEDEMAATWLELLILLKMLCLLAVKLLRISEAIDDLAKFVCSGGDARCRLNAIAVLFWSIISAGEGIIIVLCKLLLLIVGDDEEEDDDEEDENSVWLCWFCCEFVGDPLACWCCSWPQMAAWLGGRLVAI